MKTIGVYLPPSYNTSTQSYPVMYYLFGHANGTNKQMQTFTQILDSVYFNHEIRDMIIVFIDGRNRLKGSFYVNSPVSGKYEDFVIKDVVEYVDHHYRTLLTSRSRAISGHSMGGFGAVHLAMLYPDIFSVCYALSPGIFDENGLSESQMFKNGGTKKQILELISLLNPMTKDKAKESYFQYLDSCKNRDVIFTLSYGSAMSPRTDKVPYFNYPYYVHGNDTLRNDSVWKQWEDGFGGWKEKIPHYENNLRKLRLLTIDCGYYDQYQWILSGSRYYSALLAEKQIPHDLTLTQGNHGSMTKYEFRHKLLPTIASALIFE